MKKFLPGLLIIVACSMALAHRNVVSTDRMPSKFDRFDSTMVIHLYHGGGMRYESEDVYFRFDSCIRIEMEQGVDRVTKFAMTSEMRDAVLDILASYDPERIKQNDKSGFAHDKATTSICFEWNGKKDFCVMSSASTEITEKSVVNFRKLWDELQKFSVDHAKK